MFAGVKHPWHDCLVLIVGTTPFPQSTFHSDYFSGKCTIALCEPLIMDYYVSHNIFIQLIRHSLNLITFQTMMSNLIIEMQMNFQSI
jgi:hypothetical protein